MLQENRVQTGVWHHHDPSRVVFHTAAPPRWPAWRPPPGPPRRRASGKSHVDNVDRLFAKHFCLQVRECTCIFWFIYLVSYSCRNCQLKIHVGVLESEAPGALLPISSISEDFQRNSNQINISYIRLARFLQKPQKRLRGTRVLPPPLA